VIECGTDKFCFTPELTCRNCWHKHLHTHAHAHNVQPSIHSHIHIQCIHIHINTPLLHTQLTCPNLLAPASTASEAGKSLFP
jgi:hypothetical protein